MTDKESLEIFRPFVLKHAKEAGIITHDTHYTILAKCHHRGHYISVIVKNQDGSFTSYEYRFALHNQTRSSKTFPKSQSHLDDSLKMHLPIGQMQRLV